MLKKILAWFKLALPVVLALSGIGTLGFLTYLSHGAFAQISDLPEFYAPMKMIISGLGSQIYVIPEIAKFEQFYYPSASRSVVTLFVAPFGLPYMLPLALMPADLAPMIWKGFLAACLLAGILFMRAAFKLNFAAFCWLTAVVCFSGCAYEALRIDQLSTPMFMCFAAAIWALKTNRPYLAALALSGLVGKPQQLLPFVVFLFGARRYKTVSTLCGIGLLLSGVGYLMIGAEGFRNYSALLNSAVTDNRFLVSDISCTLRGQLYRFFPQQKLLMHYCSIAFLVPSLLAIFVVGHKVRQMDKWLAYGLVAAMPLGVVSALYCYYYDLLLLAPTALLLMTEFEPELPPLGILLGMAGGLAFMLPFCIFIHFDWIMKGHQFNPHFFILLVFAAGTMAFIAGKIKSAGAPVSEASAVAP